MYHYARNEPILQGVIIVILTIMYYMDIVTKLTEETVQKHSRQCGAAEEDVNSWPTLVWRMSFSRKTDTIKTYRRKVWE